MNSKGKSSNSDDVARFASTPFAVAFPLWYSKLLVSFVDRSFQRRQRASFAVGRMRLSAYWHAGRKILERQPEQGCGAKIIDRHSLKLWERNSDMKWCPLRYQKDMRSFAEVWMTEAIVQAPLAQLPWYHQLALLEKLDNESMRTWYAQIAQSEGWSCNYLVRQIETRLHERSGRAISNSIKTLPSATSAIIQDSTKDPYVFDFLEMTESHNKRGFEGELMQHVKRFLLGLGRGFAFVGLQLRLDVAGDEFFPDLISYNFILRRFVVIELKTTKSESDHPGQLGMYMSTVDDLLAQPGDEPATGLLLCKTKNSVVAEYALRGFSSPIGAAEWATEIKNSLPEDVFPAVCHPSMNWKRNLPVPISMNPLPHPNKNFKARNPINLHPEIKDFAS